MSGRAKEFELSTPTLATRQIDARAREGSSSRKSPVVEELLERAKGFEPSTPTLARSCSTPELHPHPNSGQPAAPEHPATYAKRCPPLQPPPRSAF
jgi:hypothetical protein